jgi:hypothetical protein
MNEKKKIPNNENWLPNSRSLVKKRPPPARGINAAPNLKV